MIEAAPRLLGREEEFAADSCVARWKNGGHRRTRLAGGRRRAKRGGDGDARIGSPFSGDELLVAVGRRPATRDLGLETIGLEPGRFVEVDESLRVADHGWLYAIGDANGRALLTHMGKYHGRIAADVILGRDARLEPLAGGPLAPRVVFTEPQVAAVGHTLASAQEAGIEASAVDVETSSVAAGSFYGTNAPGISRLVVDDSRRVVVGATFTGPDVAEFVHAATIAVVGEVPLERLWHATPSFPTRSEIWLRLLESYGLRRTRHRATRRRSSARSRGRAGARRRRRAPSPRSRRGRAGRTDRHRNGRGVGRP